MLKNHKLSITHIVRRSGCSTKLKLEQEISRSKGNYAIDSVRLLFWLGGDFLITISTMRGRVVLSSLLATIGSNGGFIIPSPGMMLFNKRCSMDLFIFFVPAYRLPVSSHSQGGGEPFDGCRIHHRESRQSESTARVEKRKIS